MDLLRHLSRSSVEEWPEHINRFIAAVAASDLEDATALSVLLADLTAEIRVLLGQETVAQGSEAVASAGDALSKRDILAEFQLDAGDMLAGIVRDRDPVSPLVERMLSVIEERYAEPLTLDLLAETLGRSKRYLAALFHDQTGQTIHSYLTQVRVHHAASLIRSGAKIEAVSLLVGYRSKKNFYRHFKKQLGVTPMVYRHAVVGLLPP
jgi:AraC-like DNA-binding protein